MTGGSERIEFGRIIRQQRVMLPLTLKRLARMSGVSQSYLGRIEKGERFPSAAILQKIAKPLGFEEGELLALAGCLSPQHSIISEVQPGQARRQLDPYVSQMLAQESVKVQRAVIGILAILNSFAKVESRRSA